ncbi:type I-F CRISPR-associated protein Csy2 [Vibrio diazotrophicus]|uniref:type I-F CRISPR-associated protein Csy2 n=1 Tax=Vibrio diazotrophicus TaxID=685 RepID=UPI000C9DB062|nr:type I-F CRISPR-associated protein Csy2 [Vibrio diazotrophicus]PNH79170.1 CRISPR-associated protein Csy2 [Vibrio diazotrophicus]
MTTLREILTSESVDLNNDLRKAFRPLSPPIDISDAPVEALIILVNLTDKVKQQKNLLDQTKCKEKLRDEGWWFKCINTVKYRQSHNPKFPNIRAFGVIRALPIDDLPPFMLSSCKLAKEHWAYAHDSCQMNRSVFLTSEFIWNGKVTFLGDILSDIDHPLWVTLKKLGCHEKTPKQVAKQLALIPPLDINIPLSSNYLPHISFPDNDGSYVTLSPLASQAMQSQCYNELQNQYTFSATTWISRPSTMGTLAMSCGGHFRVFHYLPPIINCKHHKILNREQWLTKKSVQALKDYVESSQWVVTSNQRTKKRKLINKDINTMISLWLGSFIGQDKLNKRQLTERFNADLSKTHFARRYAYDPKLTQLIYSSITSFKQSPIAVQTQQVNVDETYLLLPGLKISSASAMSTPVCVGTPSLMAFYGFTHAFERNIQKLIPKFRIESFAICIHSIHTENRGLTREHALDTKDNITTPAITGDWQCDSTVSLILKCQDYTQLTPYNFMSLLPKRLARGKVKVAISDIALLGKVINLNDAIQSVPYETGRWLSLNYDAQLDSTQDIITELKKDPMQTPNCIGYHLLEIPKAKSDSLRGYNHAFSESILGIIKLVAINKHTNPDIYFWRYYYSKHGPILLPRSINYETSQ